MFTRLYNEHDHFREVEAELEAMTRSGACEIDHPVEFHYKISGYDGASKFFQDYSTLLTAGRTGNLA